MAILGNNVAGGSYVSGAAAGRMIASRFTLAAAGTLNELHSWNAFGTSGNTIRVVIYKHVSGTSPDNATLVAYTNPLTMTGSSTDYDLSQAGFTVPLAAADYWLGVRFNTDGFVKGAGSGTNRGINSGVADPPPATFGVTDSGSSNTLSVWAVVGAAVVVSGFVPQIIGPI